jgi:membrane protease YdiL (CAAX protease family)
LYEVAPVLLHGLLSYPESNLRSRRESNIWKFNRPWLDLLDVENEELIPNIEVTPITPAESQAIVSHEPTPNDPPWGSWAAIGLWILSILLILIVPTLVLLPYLATRNPPITQPEQLIEYARSDPMSIVLQIAAIIPAHLLTILFAWLIATRWRKFSFFRVMGWQRGGFAWWQYIVILVVFFMVSAVVSSLVPEQDNDLIRMLKSSRSAVYIVAFVATFTAPFVEEVVYRGMLYSAFQRAMGIPAAFMLTTFLFALVHVPQYFPSYSTIFLLTVLSLTLTAIRVKTDNLLPCVVLHTLFNGIQSMFLLLEPLTRQPVPDPIGTLLGFHYK